MGAQGGGMRAGHGHLRVRGHVDDGLAEMTLDGEVDLASAQFVRDAVCDALDEGAREVVLDLTAVTLLDSTGLSALLNTARDVQRRRATLRSICPPGSEPRLVIELAGVGSLLGISE